MSDEAIRTSPQIPKRRDPTKHVFFIGHATAADNTPFETFCKDLSRDVEQLVERGVDVGFIDRGMKAGDDWERTVLDAVGTCQVFVPLLSAPCLASEYCGKEFEAFTRRRAWRRSDGALVDAAKCVLPVIWAPVKTEPAAVAKLQRFSPDSYGYPELPAYYQQHGVFGLLENEGAIGGSRYRGTVWSIALELKSRLEDYWVEPDVPSDFASLRDAFDEGA